jgi:hypothetical protein
VVMRFEKLARTLAATDGLYESAPNDVVHHIYDSYIYEAAGHHFVSTENLPQDNENHK